MVEERRGRWRVVELNQLRGVSWISVFAGVFVAYAAFPVLLALAGGFLGAANLEIDLSRTDWRDVGTGAGIVAAILLLVSWVLGGYVAGRMAQRSGAIHGIALFVTGLLLLFVVGWVAALPEGASELARRLRDFGVPASVDQWGQAATVAGTIALAAMLAGSLLGGGFAQRFQSKVTGRALEQVSNRAPEDPGAPVRVSEEPVRAAEISEATDAGAERMSRS